ncbi:OmpA family protein [Ideonella sp. A 288]|uniref:OmpA family protein n=1 Tax=Ideonella sp. A 288 TaxID=1962181 RepID=UPI001F1E1B80|nr:OmpA family protein [Ideonella sp. A 288]
MTRPLASGTLITTLLAAAVLAACSSPAMAPPGLVEARGTVRQAQQDSAVGTHAPLELKRATDTLARADGLLASGESTIEVNSVAYVANQQARTAMAIAQAKTSDVAIAGAEVERERARADRRTVEADRAKAQAATSQAQAASSQAQTRVAQAQVGAAVAQAGVARQEAAASAERAGTAERRGAIAEADAIVAQQQANQLQQRLTELQAKSTERGQLVTLGDVLFETNRANIKPAAQGSLRKLADFLAQYPERRVLIEGHTDNVGSASANEGLSRRRADAVDQMLIGLGVSSQRVSTVGYGESYPVTDNSSDTNRAMNRRVEVYIAENDQPVRARR